MPERSRTPSSPEPVPPPDLEKLIGPLKSELRSLRAIVRASGAESRRESEIKAELVALRKLVEDMRDAPLADRPEPAPGAPAPTEVVSAGGRLTAPSRGRILMFVGPTGAGKTTTIAKLAANSALALGTTVRLITLDTYRVGGIEQISTFADLIGIPLDIADSPAALAGKIDPAAGLTLIDTAGRSPRESAPIIELAAALASLPPIEVHIVVPAASSAAAIDELVTRYRPLQPARLLFTKLDEIDLSSELAQAPARTGLPVTWVTTGQAVPEDIEQPSAPRLRELARAGLLPASSRARQRSGRAA